MKKTIVEYKDRGIAQITVSDERWYSKTTYDQITKKENTIYVPSVTWISSFYPKGIGFMKWLASKGWDEAEAIKSAAGDKGSKVHYAIVALLDGQDVKMDSKFNNPSTGEGEELTLEEYEAILSFAAWFTEVRPEILLREIVVFNDKEGYAGTCDFVCRITDPKTKAASLYLIDFKTSQYLWPEHEIQISAYKHALIGQSIPDFKMGEAVTFDDKLNLAILQLGYRFNKKKFKFTDVEDQFDLFLAAKKIWQKEASAQQPSVKDYPTSICLPKPEVKKEEVKKEDGASPRKT